MLLYEGWEREGPFPLGPVHLVVSSHKVTFFIKYIKECTQSYSFFSMLFQCTKFFHGTNAPHVFVPGLGTTGTRAKLTHYITTLQSIPLTNLLPVLSTLE